MNFLATLNANRLFFCLLYFIQPVLTAQTAPSSQPPPEEEPQPIQDSVRFNFAIFVWPETGILTEGSEVSGVPRIFYESLEGMRQVPVARNVSSPLMPYHGPLPLELFDIRRIEVPPPEDAPPDTPPTIEIQKYPLASLTVPRSWRQALFILFPGQTDSKGQLRILPIRYDIDQVRPDFIRIHNTTSQSLVLEAQGTVHRLDAQGILDFRPPGSGDFRMFRGNFYGVNPDGTERLYLTSRIVARQGQSNLYLLFEAGRQLRLLRVGGHEPPPTPTPTPTPEPEPPSQQRNANRP
ncbi:MAG: hypothetical protein JJU05_13385 [Verrucomicrobia bacterium]|nr:hypothetical protein [Verrucomicrobiota bacterium]MCH8527973.1 hypothetical protein [Kiritimatiellia bacterium]